MEDIHQEYIESEIKTDIHLQRGRWGDGEEGGKEKKVDEVREDKWKRERSQ